jgi:hypothetical protein
VPGPTGGSDRAVNAAVIVVVGVALAFAVTNGLHDSADSIAMTVHVLGHALETPALALADWQGRTRHEASGSSTCIAVVLIAIVVGVGLASISLGWVGAWRR